MARACFLTWASSLAAPERRRQRRAAGGPGPLQAPGRPAACRPSAQRSCQPTGAPHAPARAHHSACSPHRPVPAGAGHQQDSGRPHARPRRPAGALRAQAMCTGCWGWCSRERRARGLLRGARLLACTPRLPQIFQVTVRNAGATSKTAVGVSDDASFLVAPVLDPANPACQLAAGVLTCAFDQLAAGEVQILTLKGGAPDTPGEAAAEAPPARPLVAGRRCGTRALWLLPAVSARQPPPSLASRSSAAPAPPRRRRLHQHRPAVPGRHPDRHRFCCVRRAGERGWGRALWLRCDVQPPAGRRRRKHHACGSLR